MDTDNLTTQKSAVQSHSWSTPLSRWFPRIREREDQVFLVLTSVIGVLTGLAVVAFILVTERLGMRLYPPGSAAWRRFLMPVDQIVNIDAPAASFAQQASIEMLEARQAERNYLLLHDANYLETNRTGVERAQQTFDRIRDLEPDDRLAIEAVTSVLELYQQRFTSAVAALGQPGQSPTDRVRAVIRAYEQDLDAFLKSSRHRNRAQVLDELRKRVDSFDSQISETVESGNPELRKVTDDLQATSQEILRVASELESRNWARVQNDHARARHLLRQAEIALSIVSAITLVLSVWVSFVLPRQVIKPLLSLKEAVDHAARGNYEIEFDVEGRGETVDLARSLQQMFAVLRQKT
jgi:CHASE3 domain sensor protein